VKEEVMKKISLLLVVLLAAGSAGLYGQMAINTEFKISGDATATLGYDIDNERFGFKNKANSDITLRLVPKDTTDNAAMDESMPSGWHGWIELKEFKIGIDHDTGGDADDIDTDWLYTVVTASGPDSCDHDQDDTDNNGYVDLDYGGENATAAEIAKRGTPASNPLTWNQGDKIPHECIQRDLVLGKTYLAPPHPTKGIGGARSDLVVTPPTITAQLQNGPLWLQIYSAPSTKAGVIPAVEDDNDAAKGTEGANRAESDDDGKDDNLTVELKAAGPGISLGYKTDGFNMGLGVSSRTAYDATKVRFNKKHKMWLPIPDKGGWILSADLGAAYGDLGIDLKLVQGVAEDVDVDPDVILTAGEQKMVSDGKLMVGHSKTGFSAQITTNIAAGVALSAGGDVVLTGKTNVVGTPEDESLEYDVGGSVDLELTDTTMGNAAFIYSSKQSVASDLEVGLSDNGGLVQNLNLGLTWGLYDLTNGKAGGSDTQDDQTDMLLKADLGYDLAAMGGTLTPGVDVTLNQVNGNSAVGVGVELVLTEAIPATEFGLRWSTPRVGDSDLLDLLPDNKTVDPRDTGEAKAGTLIAWTTIRY
jgi:hypothetical protein